MPKTHISRVAAGAVISAALAGGSLSLTAAAAAPVASAHASASTAIAVNCPPTSGNSVSDPGSGGC